MKYHCKALQNCHNCGSPISYESYSEAVETKEELELRVIREVMKLRESHLQSFLCPKKISIKSTSSYVCKRCDKTFKISRDIFEYDGFYPRDKKELKILEERITSELLTEVLTYQKECFEKHLFTRTVIFEKTLEEHLD